MPSREAAFEFSYFIEIMALVALQCFYVNELNIERCYVAIKTEHDILASWPQIKICLFCG